MGRRIKDNRKISKDRVRKVRQQKNKIIIAVEGKIKQKNYILKILIMGNNLIQLLLPKVMIQIL